MMSGRPLEECEVGDLTTRGEPPRAEAKETPSRRKVNDETGLGSFGTDESAD